MCELNICLKKTKMNDSFNQTYILNFQNHNLKIKYLESAMLHAISDSMECGMSGDVLTRRVRIDMQHIYGFCRSFVCAIKFSKWQW
jgi:hypothetical protein